MLRVPPALHAWLVDIFDRMDVYIEGFRSAAKCACTPAGAIRSTGRDEGPAAADLLSFAAALDELEAFAESIRPDHRKNADLRHQIVLLMDHRRVADVAREGRTALARA